MSKRYIEIASGYRNRNQWPCPAEFIVPIDCRNRTEDPLEALDPIVSSYPNYSWYQLPYATPLWQESTPGVSQPKPRSINGIYYTSLWPLVPTLEQNVSSTISKDSGWLGAMHFSGGTYEKPILNGVVSSPENIWSATLGNVVYNPYYTPKNGYFTGALLMRFIEDPSCNLNSWSNSQIVNIIAPFVPPAAIGDLIDQPGVSAEGIIICIISPTSFVVALSTITTNPFEPVPSVDPIGIPSSGASSAPGVFSNTLTEAYSYNGTVETSIITSYDGLTGTVTLTSPFSEDFDPMNDFYLIDFNTDPNNDWVDYVSGGARIFVPGGSSFPQAYEGLYFQNYTLSSETTNTDFGSKVIKYDFVRRIAYLDAALPLKNKTPVIINPSLYGSNTFTIRKEVPLETKTYDRISLCTGSIMELNILKSGSNYKVGEIIGTNFAGDYYDAPGSITVLSNPNYLLISRSGTGTAFRGIITNVDENGGILKIKVLQQGTSYIRSDPFQLQSNIPGSSGENSSLIAYNTYQSIEIYRNNSSDSHGELPTGNFVFLPNFGKIGTNGLLISDKTVAPTISRYFFPPNNIGVINTNTLDIRQDGYPPKVTSCDVQGNVNIPESGLYQVLSSFNKDITFGDWYLTPPLPTAISPITVLYLQNPLDINNAGLTDLGQNVFVPNNILTFFSQSSGYIQSQQIEFLQYSKDNLHPLNFTGTRVSQSQAVCFRIKLVSITLPNILLDNPLGGLIAFYPYIYVEFSNVNSPMSRNKGIIYSNNPNANKALFKVSVSDTNTPLRSKFIKLRAGGSEQTVKFTPNDDLYFRVYLQDGSLFETQQKDTAPPLPPDFFVQISAQFQIERIDYPFGKDTPIRQKH